MSIILDALRRGRGRQTPGPNPNAAQTDAVLQTLGYGRFKPTTPLNRVKRVLGYLALAVVLAVALWVAVIWLTHAYSSLALAPDGAAIRQPAPSVAPKPVPAPAPPIAAPVAPSSVAIPAGSGVPAPAVARDGTSTSARTAAVDKMAGGPNITSAPQPMRPPATTAAASQATVPPPGRAAQPHAPGTSAVRAPVAPAAPDVPSTPNRVVVQNSQRVNVPDSAPAAPTGAPSRTGVSTAAAANAATVTTGEDHFKRAMMYQRLGEFENALVSYRQVLQRDDLNVEAHNNLGVLYRDKGLFDDAIRHFQRAIAINPGYARARNNLGVVYLTQRKLDMSATQFHAALAIDPKNVESMVNLSTVEKESGQRDEARRWLTRAIDIDPRNAEAHYNLGLLEDEAGNRTQAQSHYRAFLQYGAASQPTLVGEVRKRVAALEGK